MLKKIFIGMVAGLISGLFAAGGKLLKKMSTKILRILFIIFLGYTSIKMICAWKGKLCGKL